MERGSHCRRSCCRLQGRKRIALASSSACPHPSRPPSIQPPRSRRRHAHHADGQSNRHRLALTAALMRGAEFLELERPAAPPVPYSQAEAARTVQLTLGMDRRNELDPARIEELLHEARQRGGRRSLRLHLYWSEHRRELLDKHATGRERRIDAAHEIEHRPTAFTMRDAQRHGVARA
jgi:hypothetical protein